MSETDQAYKKFAKTRKDEDFSKFLEKVKPYLKRKIYHYKLYWKKDDMLQDLSLELWKSVENYNQNKPPGPYIATIVNRTLQKFKKQHRSNKYENQKKIDPYKKTSIYKSIKGTEDINLLDLLQSDFNLENQVIKKDILDQYLEKIKQELSKMEWDIFKLYIETYENKGELAEICELTDYTYKQIDNAMTRIKRKINWVKRVVEDDK